MILLKKSNLKSNTFDIVLISFKKHNIIVCIYCRLYCRSWPLAFGCCRPTL